MADVIEVARRIIEEGPVCDHCLGRQFARLLTGLTNDRRGAAIKLVLGMIGQAGDPGLLEALAPSSIYVRKALGRDGEDEPCIVCGTLFDHLDEWADRVVSALDGVVFDTFLVGTVLSGLLAENEEVLWAESGTMWAEPLKSELNREVGKRVSVLLGKDVDFERPDVVALLNVETEHVDLQINPVFVSGRYRKLVRGIPQTRWPCRVCGGGGCERCGWTGKLYPESVEEIIQDPMIEASRGVDAVLHGSGREDIDARMLGNGRPFVMEIKEPLHRKFDLDQIRDEVNNSGKVEVFDLEFVDRAMVEHVKSVKADKVYRLIVKFKDVVEEERLKSALDILSGATISQRTPTRVSHRRADLVRERGVHQAALEEFSDEQAAIVVDCDGGLYVKELVSGDEGRTRPSLSELLGVEARVVELDVIEVRA